MTKNFSLFLALRYLRPKRTFVSVITLISIAGVTLGVAVLIIVISVMAGFHAQIKDLALGYDSHIEAFDQWGTSMMGENKRPPDVKDKPWREVALDLRQVPGVASVSPIVRGLILVESHEAVTPTLMWGIRQDDSDRLAKKHEQLLKEGKIDLSGDNIVLDENLAHAWDVKVGNKVTVYAPSNLKDIVKTMREIDDKPDAEKQDAYKALKGLVLPVDLTVTGIFSPPKLQDMSDISIVLVPLHVAQELYGMEGGVSSLGIELTDPYKAGEIKEILVGKRDKEGNLLSEPVLPDTWDARTWIEQHQALFDTVQNEMEMMYFVLFIIVIVAAFCVMNTMITVTVQKRREIGIISALGSRIGQIIWIFLSQGMIVGALGSLSGIGAGLLVVYYRNDIRFFIAKWTDREIFDSSIYGLIEIPARVVPQDVGFICAGAFLLCTIAALVPAFIAARTEPAVALRD